MNKWSNNCVRRGWFQCICFSFLRSLISWHPLLSAHTLKSILVNYTWTNLSCTPDFSGLVTATITTKEKKITVSYWFFLKPLNKNPDSDWLLTLHPSPLGKPVTQATSWCDWWENAMLHQRWLIINLHLIYLGIVVWKNKWRSPRRQGGELVVAVASSVSTLAALRTSCSLRAQTLTCLYSAS